MTQRRKGADIVRALTQKNIKKNAEGKEDEGEADFPTEIKKFIKQIRTLTTVHNIFGGILLIIVIVIALRVTAAKSKHDNFLSEQDKKIVGGYDDLKAMERDVDVQMDVFNSSDGIWQLIQEKVQDVPDWDTYAKLRNNTEALHDRSTEIIKILNEEGTDILDPLVDKKTGAPLQTHYTQQKEDKYKFRCVYMDRGCHKPNCQFEIGADQYKGYTFEIRGCIEMCNFKNAKKPGTEYGFTFNHKTGGECYCHQGPYLSHTFKDDGAAYEDFVYYKYM